LHTQNSGAAAYWRSNGKNKYDAFLQKLVRYTFSSQVGEEGS